MLLAVDLIALRQAVIYLNSHRFSSFYARSIFTRHILRLMYSQTPRPRSSLHIRCKYRGYFRWESVLCKRSYFSILPCVRCSNILAHPSFHLRNLRPLVSRWSLDGRKLRETHTKAHVVRILLHNCVFRSCGYRRILKQFEQSLTSVRPAFLVLFCKGDRIGQSFREGDDCRLSI